MQYFVLCNFKLEHVFDDRNAALLYISACLKAGYSLENFILLEGQELRIES